MTQNLKTFRIYFKNGQQLVVKAAKIEEATLFGTHGLVLLDENGKAIESVFVPMGEVLYALPVDVIVPPAGISMR